MPIHLIPPLAALIIVSMLALRSAPPALILVALAILYGAAAAALPYLESADAARMQYSPDFPLPAAYKFLIRWHSMHASAVVWAILAVLALLHHVGAGPTGRRIMSIAVAGLVLSQTVSPFLVLGALRDQGASGLTGFHLVNPVFVLIGVVSLIIFFANFMLMPLMMKSDQPTTKAEASDGR